MKIPRRQFLQLAAGAAALLRCIIFSGRMSHMGHKRASRHPLWR
jgi:hypothetical protein